MTRLTTICLFLAACGADPISFSAPVGINLKAKSGDVAGNTISEDKAITTESGNPYGAFVNAATAEIGRAPGAVEIDAMTLTLGANSTGVIALEEVFVGDVDVALITNDTNNTYDAGHIIGPSAIGPADIDVNFQSSDVTDADYQKLLSGSFKVVVRGNAAPNFMSKGAEADLQVTFTFAAFE